MFRKFMENEVKYNFLLVQMCFEIVANIKKVSKNSPEMCVIKTKPVHRSARNCTVGEGQLICSL